MDEQPGAGGPAPQHSPDGRWWWDGHQWVPARRPAEPRAAGGWSGPPGPQPGTAVGQRGGLAKLQGHGCLFWLAIVFLVVPLVVALAALAGPPVLVAGVVLAALVAINPGRTGDRIRGWGIWQRLPLLRTRSTAAGFSAALLLYAVPIPSFLTFALVSAGRPTQAGPPTAAAPVAPSATAAAATPQPAPTPTPTAVPTPAPTPVPAAPAAAQPPAAAPTGAPAPPAASRCSATVKFPTPGDGGEQTVSVSSNVPNSAFTVVVHYKTTNHTFTGGTDGSGSGSVTFSIGRPTIGYRVIVDVTVGTAACSTSFTPQ